MQDRKEIQEEVAVAQTRAARWEQEARKYASENLATRAVTGINYAAGKAGLFAAVATDGFQYAAKLAGQGFQYASAVAGDGLKAGAKLAGEVSHNVAELAREYCGKRPGKSA